MCVSAGPSLTCLTTCCVRWSIATTPSSPTPASSCLTLPRTTSRWCRLGLAHVCVGTATMGTMTTRLGVSTHTDAMTRSMVGAWLCVATGAVSLLVVPWCWRPTRTSASCVRSRRLTMTPTTRVTHTRTRSYKRGSKTKDMSTSTLGLSALSSTPRRHGTANTSHPTLTATDTTLTWGRAMASTTGASQAMVSTSCVRPMA